MKKFTTLMLALALCAGLCIPASAAKTVASTQNLSVDGAVVDCEKYNIDGSNYFKLRDLAALLNGSQAQFSVGYDAESNLVTITTGGNYEYNGSELVIGADKSASSKESRQTIQINGEEVTGISVYNIGGNNYFKLRDLSEALGFEVGYDEATRTAEVTAAPISEVTAYTYDDAGNLVAQNSVTEYGTFSSVMTYDDNGNVLTTDSKMTADGETSTQKEVSTYDENGNVVKIEVTGEESYVIEVTYDDQGRVATVTSTGDTGEQTDTYSYDGNVQTVVSVDNGETFTTVTTFDDDGNALSTKCTEASGAVTEIVYTYDDNGNAVKSVLTDAEGSLTTNYTYTYDAEGRVIVAEAVAEGDDSTDTEVYVYNAQGQNVLTRYYSSKG